MAKFAGKIFNQNKQLLYSETQYSSFIGRVREMAFESDFFVQISILEATSPLVMIDGNDLYVHTLCDELSNHNKPIPQNLINYNEENPAIDIYSLRNMCLNLSQWLNNKSGFISNNDTKLLYFIISEAARFRFVEQAIIKVLKEKISDQLRWSMFSPIIHAWTALASDKTSLANKVVPIDNGLAGLVLLPPSSSAERDNFFNTIREITQSDSEDDTSEEELDGRVDEQLTGHSM